MNQGMEGMQAQFGELRVSDTGIRENSIIGQGIGLALRGLRPVAETSSTWTTPALRPAAPERRPGHRAVAHQGRAEGPTIVRTRGHRLEGVWHSGSPMARSGTACAAWWCACPTNMQQAIRHVQHPAPERRPCPSDIECLNGYRSGADARQPR